MCIGNYLIKRSVRNLVFLKGVGYVLFWMFVVFCLDFFFRGYRYYVL